MNDLDRWTHTVCGALGLTPDQVDRDRILELTKDVAHGVARPAAPLTAYLVGLAAGRDGGGAEQSAAACAAVSRLVARWPAGDSPGDAERPRGQSPGTASG